MISKLHGCFKKLKIRRTAHFFLINLVGCKLQHRVKVVISFSKITYKDWDDNEPSSQEFVRIRNLFLTENILRYIKQTNKQKSKN